MLHDTKAPFTLTASTTGQCNIIRNLCVWQVKTGLLNPTKYYLQQTRNHQIQSYISQSLKPDSRLAPHSMPTTQQMGGGDQMHNSAAYMTVRQHHSSSSMPDPTSPLSALSSSMGNSPTEVGTPLQPTAPTEPTHHCFT